MSLRRRVLGPATLLTASLVASGALAVPQQPSSSYLGFELGEERRYVLGPAESLYSSEGAVWSMRLREVLADPPDAIFELSHEWSRAEYRTAPPVATPMSVSSSGELRVNAHGFPLSLSFRTTRQLYGYGEHVYSVRYELEGDRFHKYFSMGTRDFDYWVRIRETDELDTDVPRGLWAHAPMALECMFGLPPSTAYGPAMPGIVPPNAGANAGAVVGGSQVRFAEHVDCREPLFANPGLLSLVLPTLWEAETGELEFLLLTPAGDYGMPGVSGGGGSAGGGSVVSGGGGTRHFDSQEATRPQTNSDIEDLRYVDRVRVEVGPRTVDAWRFEGMTGFESVYVDDDGVVVRVDLEPSLASGAMPVDDLEMLEAPTRMDSRGLYIRLLFPSEY